MHVLHKQCCACSPRQIGEEPQDVAMYGHSIEMWMLKA